MLAWINSTVPGPVSVAGHVTGLIFLFFLMVEYKFKRRNIEFSWVKHNN
jgi:hypothetical protein